MTERRNPWAPHAGAATPPLADEGPDGGRDPGDTGTPDATPSPAPEASPGQDAGADGAPGAGPANPWLPPPRGSRGRGGIDDLFRPGARRNGGSGGGSTGGGGSGGGGGGRGGLPGGGLPGGWPGRWLGLRLPQRPDGKSWVPVGIGALGALWLAASTVHSIGPKEQGIVTTFGAYAATLHPGMAITLPWPIQTVVAQDVTSIRRESIPDGEGERLMLTGDQNLVNLTYLVRWHVKDLKLYTFELAEPDGTVREVAESAMRSAIGEVTLAEVMGTGRAGIEAAVRERMQQVLDRYRAGIKIDGVEIKKTDPPAKVIDAFKEVAAAQQDAQSEVNRAQAWAQQLTAHAEGEAAAFDKVYAQYRLAPEVTRRRMYYETMERVLSQTDKVIVAAPGVNPWVPLPAMTRPAPDAGNPPITVRPAPPAGANP